MKTKAKFILISMGFVCLGVFFSQLFLYEIEELLEAKSMVSLGSVFIIAITSILSGVLINSNEGSE